MPWDVGVERPRTSEPSNRLYFHGSLRRTAALVIEGGRGTSASFEIRLLFLKICQLAEDTRFSEVKPVENYIMCVSVVVEHRRCRIAVRARGLSAWSQALPYRAHAIRLQGNSSMPQDINGIHQTRTSCVATAETHSLVSPPFRGSAVWGNIPFHRILHRSVLVDAPLSG